MDLQLITNWQLRLSIKMEIHQMQIKYPEKAIRWQPEYIGFDVKQVEIDVDTRIFPLSVIERTVSMLIDQIESVEAEDHDSFQLTIHLHFFSDLSEREIEDLFYSKLLCAKVMLLTFEKTENLRKLFQNTAQFATTTVQNEVERQLIPILKRYKPQIDFKMFYITDDFGGSTYDPARFDSLHGIPEIWENVRQLVIAKYYPEVFLDYLLCYTKNYRNYESWKACASPLGIDTKKVEQLTQSEEGFSLLSDNIKKQPLSIQDSPTLIVDGTVYKSKDFGIQHCSSTQRSQSEYSEIVPILRFPFEKAVNPKVFKFASEQQQYLSNIQTIVKKTTETRSLTEMLKPDALKLLEELEPIPDTLTEMLKQWPENPYLAILLGEVHRARGASQEVIRLNDQMGFILNRDWLIIGPWVTKSNYRGLTAFNEVLPPERRIELNQKYKAVSKTSRNQWLEREVHWVYPIFDIVQSYVDLRSVLKTSTMACYALSYAKLPVSTKTQMRLGVSGALKVWVNDKLIYLNPNQKYTPRIDEYIVPVELKKGLNKILVKVVQRGEKVTGFYLRLTDRNGKPLDNVEIALPLEAAHLPRKHSMLWRVYSQKPK